VNWGRVFVGSGKHDSLAEPGLPLLTKGLGAGGQRDAPALVGVARICCMPDLAAGAPEDCRRVDKGTLEFQADFGSVTVGLGKEAEDKAVPPLPEPGELLQFMSDTAASFAAGKLGLGRILFVRCSARIEGRSLFSPPISKQNLFSSFRNLETQDVRLAATTKAGRKVQNLHFLRIAEDFHPEINDCPKVIITFRTKPGQNAGQTQWLLLSHLI
jgi:hypothetical protein